MSESNIADKIAQFNATAASYINHPPNPRLSPLAIAWYQKSLSLNPESEETLLALARAYYRLGDSKKAIECCNSILKFNPDSLSAYFYRCMVQIPIIYNDSREIQSTRQKYQEELLQLYDKVQNASLEAVLPLANAIGTITPFYLIYASYNDTVLQHLYGQLITTIMARCYPQVSKSSSSNFSQKGGRITVGIPFGFFRQHSVWKVIVKGWLSQLDRDKFRLIAYSLGDMKDAQTETARQLCEVFREGPHTLEEWMQLIRTDAPDILIYPEVSMHRVAIQLSALRLAPIQCTTWATYVTSGLPSIDYYLSGALIEPKEATDHYTEELVILPELSIHYTPPPVISSDLTPSNLGLPSNATIYLCLQSLFKYLPDYDYIYPKIAQSVENSHFVFLKSKASTLLTHQFYQRLKSEFSQYNMEVDEYVTMLPSLSNEAYYRLHEIAAVFLDSIGTGGTTTTLEALSYNIPIITLPSDFMRGRVSGGILNHIGMSETIATSVKDYIDLAISLGKDKIMRQRLREQMALHKEKAYHNISCIKQLEQFIANVVHQDIKTKY